MTKSMFLKRLWILTITFFVCAAPLLAQFRSSIEGTVSDASGAVLADVSVELTNTATGITQTVQTSTAGVFRFPTLPPGTYTLKASKQGFQSLSQENVSLLAQESRTVPFVLKVGSVQETVTVTSEAAAIQLAESKIGADISAKEITELPLSGRNVFNMVSFTPGVTGVGQASGGAFDNSVFSLVNGGNTNANGQRGDANAFYLDNTFATSNPDPGVYNLTPNPDSIEEFHVSVNDYSAEYGHSGGLVIQAVTKSGSNKLHGSLFEYHTDNKLTSRNEFQNTKDPLTGRYFPVSRRNEFGGAVGGPIQKDKMFFFFSWDQLISAQATTIQQTVEDPDFVNFMKTNFPNNLSTHLMTTYPASIQGVVPGSVLTVNDLYKDPTTGQPLCATLGPPVAGMPCNLNLVETTTDSFAPKNNGLQWNVRIDRYFRDSKDRVNGNYFRKTPNTITANVRPAFANPNAFAGITNYANLDWTHTFSNTMVNDAAFGITRISGLGTCNQCQVPPIGIDAIAAGFGNGFAPAEFIQNDFHWRDVLSFTHGKHNFKAGLEIFRDQENDLFNGPQLRPSYQFSNNSPTGKINSIFDFANDQPTSETNINFDLRTGGPAFQDVGYRSTTFGYFLQDDYKVKSNLSINAGIRWDFSSNPNEITGRMTNIILGSGTNLFNQVQGASVQIVPDLLKTHRIGYFAPRLGFAWDPTKQGKLSIRGGMGVFYNRWPNKVWSDPTRGNPPFEAGTGAFLGTAGPQPAYGLCQTADQPFNCVIPTGLPIGLNARGGALDNSSSIGGTIPDLKYSYNIGRFLGAQYAITPNWVVEGNYTGSHDVHLYVNTDRNRCFGCFDPVTGSRIGLQPNPFFVSVNLTDNSGWSYHNGGTFSLLHRFSKGSTFQVAYTFGSTTSNVDAPTPGHDSSFATVYNPYDPNFQKGPAAFDIKQALTMHGVWELPRLSNMNAFTRGFLGGWQLTGSASFQGGYPYTVQDCNHSPDGGVTCVLPNVTASAKGKTCDRSQFLTGCLDAAAFSLPCAVNANNRLDCTSGVWEGDTGRNSFRGPGYANVDFSTMKYFQIPWFTHEGARLQIRGEFFNLFNRVNLNTVNNDLALVAGTSTNPNFTKAQGVYNPRTIQIGARIEF
jgi:hypothetical protein